MLREWIKISAPKEPDFFKSTVLGEDDKVQGVGGVVGELCHPFHEMSSIDLCCQRHVGSGFQKGWYDGENLTSVQDDDQRPSNQFGRGQRMSSVSTGRCGGIGWRPKPYQRLLGGSGKKIGPKTKSRKSADGM